MSVYLPKYRYLITSIKHREQRCPDKKSFSVTKPDDWEIAIQHR